ALRGQKDSGGRQHADETRMTRGLKHGRSPVVGEVSGLTTQNTRETGKRGQAIKSYFVNEGPERLQPATAYAPLPTTEPRRAPSVAQSHRRMATIYAQFGDAPCFFIL